MKFKSGTRRRALQYEKDIVRYWKENKTFEKSVEQRPVENSYVFYDGPPFITGVPHHGTLLSSIVKDAIPRYQTMKGKRVERVWGWDTHGLPAENFVEKKLGITRHDIGTKVSLEEYIATARESMVQTGALWEDTVDRIGRWVDFKGAYKTMDKEYMESIWWAFKTLYEKGKIYEGEKVLMYDTKWATPLSKAEVTMDAGAYVDVTDPSVYVKFKVKNYADLAKRTGVIFDPDNHPEAYLLAWTTTPWTLPANAALAVNPNLTYYTVGIGEDVFVVAEDLIDKVFQDEKHQPIQYSKFSGFKGSTLVDLEYEPLFDDQGKNAHKVWAADYVTTESGTGIVHLAPAYGEEDFELATAKNIPILHTLDDYGYYLPEFAKELHELGVQDTDEEGIEVWAANKFIAKKLEDHGKVWKIEYIRHEYPHNPRTGQRLMYRAHPSWFFDIEGQRVEMLARNSEDITWFPEHIKHGRFEKTIEQAPDWNLSRDRFWATAMPVWKSEDGDVKVVGSYAELKQLSGVDLEDYHRPWIDDVEFDFEGKHYKRIDKVIDGWFESGSMPFAQFHYPFENKDKFEANFPGDFIAEYVGQVRAWFYYLHAVNVALFGTSAFKHVIVTGNLMGNDGYKLSKSRGNFTDPNELMDQFSADSLRFLMLSSPVMNAEDATLLDKDVGDVARKLSMVWNMYDFFTLYAEVDGWEFSDDMRDEAGLPTDPSQNLQSPLDQWIVSRLHQLIQEVEKYTDAYDIPNALKPVLPFIDDASNWYVRRSRRRFWKSDDDSDKQQAYRTLHYVLVRLSQVMAPFTPFLSEELYRNLTGGESVHLTDWPEVGHYDELVLGRMARTRQVIEQGLALRMQKDETQQQVKVRQPLSSLSYGGEQLGDFYEAIIAEEVNVKQVTYREDDETVELDKTITHELKLEGLAREVIRHVQSARKDAGLSVDDRIVLSLATGDNELAAAISQFEDVIAAETLAERVSDSNYAHRSVVSIDDAEMVVSLQKQ